MSENIPASEITPRHVYLNRRAFLRGGLLAATAAGSALLYRRLNGLDLMTNEQPEIRGIVKATDVPPVGEPLTPRASVINYNNFYEFTTDKDGVAAAAKNFKTTGWKIEVGGLCARPGTLDLDDLRRLSPPEERVYRHRCVEGWSMVIPWVAIPLAKLIDKY